MIRGMYAAGSALDALNVQQDVVTHNIAHVNHAGFKRKVTAFEPWLRNNALLGTVATVHNDFQNGIPVVTENPLDVHINNDGFFVVSGPNGPLYTRNGTFQVNSQGQVVTMEGLALNGTDGPLTVPPETSSITVMDDGVVLADNNEVGQIQTVQFADTKRLNRVGDSLFRAPNGVVPQNIDPDVTQGVREQANTDVIGEMALMISTMRHYEASQRALRSLSDVIESVTKPGR